MRWLRAARLVAAGGLLAHPTSTVCGVAAHPRHPAALRRLQRFKGRQGPFILLADGPETVARLVRHFTPPLRRFLHRWPERTTLVFPARPLLPPCLYQKGHLAVRVDPFPACRVLARACGGLVCSSSLNRRGGRTRPAHRRTFYRWHRHLDGWLAGREGGGGPSRLVRLSRQGARILR